MTGAPHAAGLRPFPPTALRRAGAEFRRQDRLPVPLPSSNSPIPDIPATGPIPAPRARATWSAADPRKWHTNFPVGLRKGRPFATLSRHGSAIHQATATERARRHRCLAHSWKGPEGANPVFEIESGLRAIQKRRNSAHATKDCLHHLFGWSGSHDPEARCPARIRSSCHG
jgi:hypothetical protein